MSPLPLYSVGRAGTEFFSDTEDEIDQPSFAFGHGTIFGLVTEPVEVSNLHFQSCVTMRLEEFLIYLQNPMGMICFNIITWTASPMQLQSMCV